MTTDIDTDIESSADAESRPEGPPEKMLARRTELTPMLSQYLDCCETHPDALVLFQVGDFYEAFCEAAATVARVCEVTLTQREDSTGTYRMAGIPIDNATSYIKSLLSADFRVAIAEQVEDAGATNGLVDRAVTDIITPGTVTSGDLLEDPTATYLGAVSATNLEDDSLETTGAIATVDVSTGACRVTSVEYDRVHEELNRLTPAELLIGPKVDTETIEPSSLPFETMQTTHTAEAFDITAATNTLEAYIDEPTALLSSVERRAVGALLDYAEYTQGDRGPLEYVSRIRRYHTDTALRLDATAIQSLELFNSRQPHGETLIETIDETASALGRRTLESWIRRPLVDSGAIERRHDAVSMLSANPLLVETLTEKLSQIYDLERLTARIARERADARNMRSLLQSLNNIPALNSALTETITKIDSPPKALEQLQSDLDSLDDIRELIDAAICPDPPQTVTDGDVIAEGFNDELDDIRATEKSGREWVSDLETRERERTGIDSLEVGYTEVHGYYIEVTNPNLDCVPDEYTRRQTLKNAERFYTPALKRREDEIIAASERADNLEYELFCDVRTEVAAETTRLQAVADTIGRLDALVSYATIATSYAYVRPEITADAPIIEGGRHPVVEQAQAEFVPNGINFENGHLAMITGPNMSGKSTYMRQIAHICILAQAGSFVPADTAHIPILDRVFTRIGASDDIAGGESTFMREMSEMTDILHDATESSLILLDEVGRGTSTTDGRAIARATTEFIHDEVGAWTLFTTHYHNLTDATTSLPSAFNLHFRVHRETHSDNNDQSVTFLHRVAPGTADSSYGIEVAKLAGVPTPVVEQARQYVHSDSQGQTAHSEQNTNIKNSTSDKSLKKDSGTNSDNITPTLISDNTHTTKSSDEDGRNRDNIDADTGTESNIDTSDLITDQYARSANVDVLKSLRDIDIARMTPLEALNMLENLQRRLDE
ncbi:DNA mismatch repair protein MutS [Haloquadratum walsbyi]|jgi:DNA mismatch repair protein MutS|uniref:DNA mismatch repair protein MutS n=1 Tax=Haloquadratum walsbyi J07HQW2 TaxID=1238425 RepID=U1NEL1_9EURY|nr:DNA mismatch repair protein MutS [Haloquadratum walsbyi]ERG95450.1 MAG: DNA mismatch repair protein MutS [Haloquadratum walsbyi J07HQW2]